MKVIKTDSEPVHMNKLSPAVFPRGESPPKRCSRLRDFEKSHTNPRDYGIFSADFDIFQQISGNFSRF